MNVWHVMKNSVNEMIKQNIYQLFYFFHTFSVSTQQSLWQQFNLTSVLWKFDGSTKLHTNTQHFRGNLVVRPLLKFLS